MALRRRINALNASGAEAAYGGLRASLDRLLPDFLRSSQPLAYADVLAGIETLRPSHAAGRLEDLVATFLQKLEPLQAAIQPGIDGFFQNIRDTVNLLNPLSIKDSVASVYDLIRQKIKVLDPAQLADQLKKDVFDPVTSAITQLDPAQWKQRLDQAFQRVVAALTNNVKAILDDIVATVDVQLRAIREQIQSVVIQIKAVFASVLQDLQAVLDKVKHLVFVEILERLRKLIDNLEGSFGQELDRVRAAFDEMLAAIPLGGSAASQVAA
jgi:translation elongation factor EF-G